MKNKKIIEEQQETFLALLPLKNVVILPKSIIPIIVGRQSSIQAVESSLKNNKSIFITAQKDPQVETPTQDDIFTYDTPEILSFAFICSISVV